MGESGKNKVEYGEVKMYCLDIKFKVPLRIETEVELADGGRATVTTVFEFENNNLAASYCKTIAKIFPLKNATEKIQRIFGQVSFDCEKRGELKKVDEQTLEFVTLSLDSADLIHNAFCAILGDY